VTHCIYLKGKTKVEQEDFSTWASNTEKANKLTNGAILIISTVLKHLMPSAASGAVLLNAKE
jgi:hypothetical protein